MNRCIIYNQNVEEGDILIDRMASIAVAYIFPHLHLIPLHELDSEGYSALYYLKSAITSSTSVILERTIAPLASLFIPRMISLYGVSPWLVTSVRGDSFITALVNAVAASDDIINDLKHDLTQVGISLDDINKINNSIQWRMDHYLNYKNIIQQAIDSYEIFLDCVTEYIRLYMINDLSDIVIDYLNETDDGDVVVRHQHDNTDSDSDSNNDNNNNNNNNDR
jgi:hypothetical protein